MYSYIWAIALKLPNFQHSRDSGYKINSEWKCGYFFTNWCILYLALIIWCYTDIAQFILYIWTMWLYYENKKNKSNAGIINFYFGHMTASASSLGESIFLQTQHLFLIFIFLLANPFCCDYISKIITKSDCIKCVIWTLMIAMVYYV